MAFDDALAGRVRRQLGGIDGVSEKKMFGGLAFLVNGNMCGGVHGSELIVRMDPDGATRALSETGVRVFDLSGRPMKGWLLVDPAVLADSGALARWVTRGVDFAASLPPK